MRVKIWRFVRMDPGVASGRVQTPLPEFCRILFFASTVVRARFPSAQTESASPDKIQHHPLEISTALEEPSTPLVALQVNEPVPPQNSTKWPSARRFVMLYYPIQDEWLHRLSRHCLDFPTPRRNRPTIFPHWRQWHTSRARFGGWVREGHVGRLRNSPERNARR